MKYSKQYPVFRLLFVIYLFDCVICTDNIYERVSGYVQDSDYVDPQSLYYNRQSQTVNAPRNHDSAEGHQLAVQKAGVYLSCKDNTYEVFSRRLVNMIISKSNFKIDDGLAFGKLELEATIEELETLKIYGEGKLSIRQIDDILSNVIRPVEINFFDEALNFMDRISIYVYQHRIIFGSILLVLFVIIIALKVKWTRFRVIILLFDVVVIASFMLTWWELLQEAEIKLAAQRSIYYRMPDECKQDKISLWSSFWLFLGIGKGDCLKYYEAVMTDPLLKVTPLHAFSHMATKFFFHPMSMAGHYISDFIESITGSIPFPFNHIAKLLLVIFIPGLFGSLMFVSLGGSMGLRIGPLLHLYLHSKSAETPEVRLENVNREAIEIIRSEVAEIKASTSNNTTSLLSRSPNSPKKIKASTQTEEIIESKPKTKPGDSDSNGEEFPEEKEYEKISRVCLEEEINKETLNDTSDSNVKKRSSNNENESIVSKTIVKNKTSLDVKSKSE